ncbi:Uncharacterised protein [Mycobacteroides abscessus subsp. abscessus]|nr:Uncharacterised protein [Mycobacteroides abscessus subsp. abscessus]
MVCTESIIASVGLTASMCPSTLCRSDSEAR